MKYTPISGSAWSNRSYGRICPRCHAPRWHYCITRDGKPARKTHAKRSESFVPAPMPDLSKWFRDMRVYEPGIGLKRPADLVVP